MKKKDKISFKQNKFNFKKKFINLKLGKTTLLKFKSLMALQNNCLFFSKNYFNLITRFKNTKLFINHTLKKYEIFSLLKKKKSYKFKRYKNNLPLRGQRTHTNARTRKEFFII
jgi:ribosomal protein S13